MNETITLLFSLLRDELFNIPLPVPPKALSEEQLTGLYQLSNPHDLAHLVGDALYRNHLLPKGTPMAEKFQKAQVTALYRYTSMEHERKKIYAIFEQEKIPFIPLKGILIRPLYPQPYLRTSCDIDILVRKEDLNRAVETLIKLGYTKNKGELCYHDISLFSPGGIHLELHFTLENDWEPIDRLLSKAWDYCTPVDEGRAEHRHSPEFFIFHQIAHMVSHFLNGGCGIRPLLDLQLLRLKMPFDEETVQAMCEDCDIGLFYSHAKELSDVWFGEQAHNDVTVRMATYILSGGVYGTIGNTVAVKQQQKGSRFAFLMYRIFMPYRQLKIKYPVLVKHKWLYPFMTVRRWLTLLSPTRRKHAQLELLQSAQISENQQQNIADLLNDLGLS